MAGAIAIYWVTIASHEYSTDITPSAKPWLKSVFYCWIFSRVHYFNIQRQGYLPTVDIASESIAAFSRLLVLVLMDTSTLRMELPTDGRDLNSTCL